MNRFLVERTPPSSPHIVIAAAMIAVIFGLLTLFSGGAVLFFDGPARVAAGNYVPFVLWFNFLAGFTYIAAGAGLLLWRAWAVNLALWIALATLVMFAVFGIHILTGNDYEMRTVGAMALRAVVWLSIALYTRKAWNSV